MSVIFKYNPITGNLDLVNKSGSSYNIYGYVTAYADLPLGVTSSDPKIGDVVGVNTTTGTWILGTQRREGFYKRSALTGVIATDYGTTPIAGFTPQASQVEVNTGTDDTKTLTPLTFQNSQQLVDIYSTINGIEPPAGGYANNLYFSGVASDIPTYLTLSYTPDAIETIHTHTVNSSEGNKLIHTYLHPTGVTIDLFPSGLWSFTFYGNVSATNGITQIGITYFKRSALGIETDLFTVWSNELNNTSDDWIKFQMTEPSYILDVTDRMGAKVYIKTTHNNNITVTYRIGDGYAAYLNNPNKIRHSQLRDLNGDSNYQHITSTEKTSISYHAKLTPLTDSTTAIQITRQDGTTAIFNVDSSNRLIQIGNIGSGNYSEFELNGFFKGVGTNLYWKDIDFPIIIRTTGTNIPTLTTFNGNLTMPQWEVNDYNVCESQEFVHEWKEGSECHWHVHLNTNGLDTTNRYVRFELEYGYTNSSFVWTFPAVFTTPDILIPANTPDKSQIIISITNFTPTGTKIGGHVVARLRRVASVGTAPTNNPWIPMLQLHVQCDTMGSRNITSK